MSSSCDFSLTPFAFKLLSSCIISFFTVLNSASVNECVQVGHGTPGRIPVAFLYNLLYSECTAFNSASVLLPSLANFETYCLFWISIRFFSSASISSLDDDFFAALYCCFIFSTSIPANCFSITDAILAFKVFILVSSLFLVTELASSCSSKSAS